MVDNGGVISVGEVDINFSGETKLGVEFENVFDFDEGFFSTDNLFDLTTGDDGWSKKSNPERS